jgi:hypothetical protein
VARSYFSRLVRGGESALLAPPRPVSNLWKTAQIDAATAAPDAEPLSARPRSTVQRSRVAETVPPLIPAEVESWHAAHLSPAKPLQSSSKTRASTRAAQTSVSGERLRPTPTAATSGRTETTRPDTGSRAGQAQAGPSLQVREPAAPELAANSSARSISARRAPSTQAVGPTPAARPAEAKLIPTEARPPEAVEPISPVVRPAAESQPMRVSERTPQDDAADATRAARAFPAPTPALMAEAATPALRPQARLQPIESATPGSRGPSRRARQSSIPEEPREKANTVQIGKIEVQVVPPPASRYLPAPPAQPKVRLARGYALWPGW